MAKRAADPPPTVELDNEDDNTVGPMPPPDPSKVVQKKRKSNVNFSSKHQNSGATFSSPLFRTGIRRCIFEKHTRGRSVRKIIHA